MSENIIEQAQTVGHWESQISMPDNERFTWHKPSINAFALREPAVTPAQLEQRYHQAKRELTYAAEKTPVPKRIAEQLAEAAKQVERGTDVPINKHHKSHEDR